MSPDLVSSVWIVMATATGFLVLARVVTLRRMPETWWVAYTATFAGISIGCALMIDEDGVNRQVGIPNLAHLLADLCIVVAGCSIVIYLGLLLWQEKNRLLIQVATVSAMLVAAIMIAGWSFAPIHDVYFPTARDVPIVGSLVAYELSFHLYVLAVLGFNVALVSTAERVVARNDPAASLNKLVGTSVVIIGVGQLIHLAKLHPALRSDSVLLGNVGDLVTLIGIVGTSAVNTVIFLGPRLSLAQRSRRLLRELEPLNAQLLRAHPQVHFASIHPPPWRVSLRAERMMIEIGDALSILRVDKGAARVCPFAAVTDSLRAGPTELDSATSTVTAMSALPTPHSRAEEEALLIKLSRRVRADAS